MYAILPSVAALYTLWLKMRKPVQLPPVRTLSTMQLSIVSAAAVVWCVHVVLQRQVPSPSRGTPRSRWRSSTQQLAQLAPLAMHHDAPAAAASMDGALAGAPHAGRPVHADALLDAAALLDLEPHYQGPSLSAPPAPDAHAAGVNGAALAHRSTQHAQRGGFLQQRMSAASGSRLSPQITPQSTPMHSPMNRGASGEVQGPLILPPAALGAPTAAGDSILAAAAGDTMLAAALGEGMLAAAPDGARGAADGMLAAAVAAAVAAGGGAAGGAAGIRGPGRGYLHRPLTPPLPPGASAAAAAGHMAGYVSGEEEGAVAGWMEHQQGAVLAAVAPSSSSGRRGRGRTRGRGRGQHGSSGTGPGGSGAEAGGDAGTEAAAIGTAGGGGVRTRSSGHAAVPGGAAGSAQAAADAAVAAAAGYGSDGDSDHSRRSTSSHRRKAAPHRAGFGA